MVVVMDQSEGAIIFQMEEDPVVHLQDEIVEGEMDDSMEEAAEEWEEAIIFRMEGDPVVDLVDEVLEEVMDGTVEEVGTVPQAVVGEIKAVVVEETKAVVEASQEAVHTMPRDGVDGTVQLMIDNEKWHESMKGLLGTTTEKEVVVVVCYTTETEIHTTKVMMAVDT